MIRKIVLFAAAALLAVEASAQTEMGKIFIGGSSSFSYSSGKSVDKYDGTASPEAKARVIEIAPQAGYFIMDNLAVGLAVDFASSKGKIGSGNWSDPVRETTIAAFGRYYLSGFGNIKPFGEAKLGHVSSSTGNDDANKDRGFGFGLGVGAAYFLNQTFAVEAGLSYETASLKNKKDSKAVENRSGLGVSIGVAIHF